MLGSKVLGSTRLGTPSPQSALGPEFALDVDGDGGVGEDLDVETFQVSQALGGRTICEFTVPDIPRTFSPAIGRRVFAMRHGNVFFGGTVEEVDYSLTNAPNHRMVAVRAADWVELLGRYLIVDVYANQTLQQIVTDILTVHNGGALATEGFSVGTFGPAPKITAITFDYDTVNECFDRLAEITGTAWHVTPYRVVNFSPVNEYTAPFTIGDSGEPFRGAQLSHRRSKFRNEQYLKAGKGKTEERIEFFRGETGANDKRRRTFNTAFPVAEKPRIFVNTVEIPANRIGVKGKDEDGDVTKPSPTTWKKWFFSVGSAEISQNSDEDPSNLPLDTGDLLEVRYKGEFDLIVLSRNDSDVATTAAAEGGSGLYQRLEEKTEIDTEDLAVETGDRLLSIYGRRPRTLSVEVDRFGLAPGQSMSVTIAGLSLSGVSFMVDSANLSLITPYKYRHNVTMIDGEHVGAFGDIFKRLYRRGKKLTANDNAKLLVTKALSDTVQMDDSVLVENSDTSFAYTGDPYTWAVMAKVTVASEDIYGWVIGRSRIGRPHGS